MPTGYWGHIVARGQRVPPQFFGHMAFGYEACLCGVQGCFALTPFDAVAPLVWPGWRPRAGVCVGICAGANWESAASERDLARPCKRYLSLRGTPSFESDKAIVALTPRRAERFVDALALGESAVRGLGASLAFVGEYSTVASMGCSSDLFEWRSTSIATIGIDARETPGT